MDFHRTLYVVAVNTPSIPYNSVLALARVMGVVSSNDEHAVGTGFYKGEYENVVAVRSRALAFSLLHGWQQDTLLEVVNYETQGRVGRILSPWQSEQPVDLGQMMWVPQYDAGVVMDREAWTRFDLPQGTRWLVTK